VIDERGIRVEEVDLGSPVSLPAAVRADGAVVATTSAGVCRVRLGAPGGDVAVVVARGPVTAPVLTRRGVALAGSEDWVLYAASFGDPLTAEGGSGGGIAGPWPQPRHDAGQSGRASTGGASTAYLVLRELAASPLVSQKEEVLEAVRRHLAGESFLPLSASELEGLLVFLAQEGAQSPVYVGEQETTDHPTLRVAACGQLGALGTQGARLALIGVVEKDPRREVQSTATAALGLVGYDPDGRASGALERLAARWTSDEALLLGVVGALASIAAATGPEVGLGDAAGPTAEETASSSRPAWSALIALAAGRYPARVAAAARQALAELVRAARR
jgi:hypothetical protein